MSDIADFPDDTAGQIAYLVKRLDSYEARDRNRRRIGTVKEVDYKKRLARVDLSSDKSGKPFLTGWIRWREVAAGGTHVSVPVSVGEQVSVVSENGEMTDAEIDMSIPSDANPSPHDGPEPVITRGNSRITIGDNGVTIKTGTLTVEGSLLIKGGTVKHNDKNIGDTHKHGGVVAGSVNTDVPAV